MEELKSKLFVMTSEQRELLIWNLNNHQIMDAKWIVRQFPEIEDQEELINHLKKENEEKEKEIADLIDKLLNEEK